ncbi:MAG: M48 family metalloprotease [Rhizomicrobium sp.]
MTTHKRLASIFAAHLFAFAPGLAHAQSFPLPDFGGKSGSGKELPAGLGDLLGQVKNLTGGQSADDEARSGEAIAATVFGAAPLWRKPAAQSYVNLVGRNLARQAERKDVQWRFAILDTPSINAMAFPGGIVVITRGLYALLTTEDELAAVLAHEIAHVNRRHQWKVIQQQKLVALAGDTVARSDPGRSAQVVADLGAKLIARGLDKSAEFEADRDGVVIAARAGYDSSALIAVMERLKTLKTGEADTALLFSTHPSPEARIAALTAAATAELELAAEPSAAASRIRVAH